MDKDDVITLNVGGVRHVTYTHVLKKIPATRLSKLNRSVANYDPVLEEYFFDRHPRVFQEVINYYRTGKLHYPLHVCGSLFEEKLEFWQLDHEQVSPCCWMTYTRHRETQDTLNIIDRMDLFDQHRVAQNLSEQQIAFRFGFEDDYFAGTMSRWQILKPKISALFEEPPIFNGFKHIKSVWPWAISMVSMITVIVSVTVFCLKSEPTMRIPVLRAAPLTALLSNESLRELNCVPKYPLRYEDRNDPCEVHEYVEEYTNCSDLKVLETIKINGRPAVTFLYKEETKDWFVFAWVDGLCNVWFLIELVVRFTSCPNKRTFLQSPMNLLEILAISSFTIDQILKYVVKVPIAFFKFFAIVRIMRIMKLTRHSSGLKILVQTFKASLRELGLLLFFLIAMILIFATLIYYAERMQVNPDNDFESISMGLWWALVTICSIGYGDQVPKTSTGQLVGATCCIISVLIVALPVPVIVSNFSLLYTHATARAKLPIKRERVMTATEMLVQASIHHL